MKNRNLEKFLKRGTAYVPTLWDDQIGYFLLMLPFIALQIVKSIILPCICAVIEILLLISCAKKEQSLYGNVYCSMVHLFIMGMVFWIDGWVALSFIGISEFWFLVLTGNIIYAGMVSIRVLVIKKRLVNGWYEKQKKK